MVNIKSRISVGADLEHLDIDKSISTDPEENRKRRTLKLTRKDNSWGFTLQSYGIKHKKTNEVEVMTYVDYVDIGGAAWMAGLRRGDVILSVNGENVALESHRYLVNRIRSAGDTMRLVVLFEDCCRKVELHDRYLRLKMVMKDKLEELKDLELKERLILEKYGAAKGLSRFDEIRQSIMSSASSDSNSWDRFSLVSSPNLLNNTPNHHFNQWPSTSSMRSLEWADNSSYLEGDNSSCLEEESLEYIDSVSDGSAECMVCTFNLTDNPQCQTSAATNCAKCKKLQENGDDVFHEDVQPNLGTYKRGLSVSQNCIDENREEQSAKDVYTFHVENDSVVYINDKDEVTRL